MAHNDSTQSIPYISPGQMGKDFLNEYIYNLKDINYYWSDCWESSFYIDLARAGFISVAMDHEHLGSILMPELQHSYAVLDWENLHVSQKVRKILNRGRLESQGFSFAFVPDPGCVMESIINQFDQSSWLTPAYQKLVYDLCELPSSSAFTFHTVELRRDTKLIAGEIGYSCGSVYTSLSGFSSRKKEHNNMGHLQMILLAQHLKKQNYAFWNLGHPYMDYKIDLGAQVLSREDFLKRWFLNI